MYQAIVFLPLIGFLIVGLFGSSLGAKASEYITSGLMVIAAAHNDHPITASYPALFAPPLVSVDKGTFGQPLEFAYRLLERIEFQAYSLGYVGPFADEPATSWATPHLTGVVARLLSLRPELKPFEIKTLLYWLGRSGERGA